MSTSDALQSPPITAISQITGKRKRVGSTDETGNVEDDQDDGHTPRKQNQNLHGFLVDIVEILRRFVSTSCFTVPAIRTCSRPFVTSVHGCEHQTDRLGHPARIQLHQSWTTKSLPSLGMARYTMQNEQSYLNRPRSSRSDLGSSPGHTPILRRLLQISRQLFPRSFMSYNRRPLR